MKLSEIHPDDVQLVSPSPDGDDSGAPLKLSTLHPDSVQLVQVGPEKPGFLANSVKSTIDSLPMIGGVVGGILGTPADVVMGPMGNIVGAAALGGLGVATKNYINSYYDPASAPQTTTQGFVQPVVGGVEQGLMQGTGEAAAPYIAKGLQAGAGVVKGATKWGGSKALSLALGANQKAIQEYAQNSARINSQPSVEALKDISDNVVGNLAADVDAKKTTLTQAKDVLKDFQLDLRGAYQTQGYDAKAALNSAQQTLKDAHGSRLQQLSGDIYDTVNQLKSDVQAGSGKALDTLNQSNAKIDLAPVYNHIDQSIAQLKQAGTDDALAVADKLQAYKERLLKNNWANIPAPAAKKLIQGLDQATTYSPMAGSFDQAKNAAFKGIRGTLDQSVKAAVPEYAAAMEPVAADADLLNRVQGFGDKQQAVGLLQRVNAPNQLENRAALQQLGKKYGVDYVNAAQPGNLPEQQLVNKAQAGVDAIRGDRVSEKIDQTVAGSRQKAVLDTAQSQFDQAQQDLAPFKSLAPNTAGQTTAQQKLLELGKGKNIELTDMFQRLGKLSDTDFVQAMKDHNTLAAFQKGATNGSRNTLMGGIAGWALGGTGGMAMGAGAGRAVDQWGPVVTKKILDGVIKVADSPTIATISSLELPEPVKKNMIVGLQNYLAQGGQTAGQVASRVAGTDSNTNRSPARGPDAWAQRGIQSLGIQDPSIASRLMQDPRGKQLLIQASDLKPGSKAMKSINDQIQQFLKGAK